MTSKTDTAVFVRVVQEGGFTAAARSLELSKGAVSKLVSRLEARLGARLLNRTTRRITLTEVGDAFYRRAVIALGELEDAEREVTEHTGTPRGHLRVSAPSFYGAEILSRYLAEFRRRYPDISLELRLENRLVDLVEERFDVAIRMSAPRDSSLVMRHLADIPMLVCASPDYLERHGTPETPEALGLHECLVYLLVPRPHEWIFVSADGGRYAVHVEGRLRTDDDHALRRAGLDGLGILRMPALFVQEAIAAGALVQLWPAAMSPGVTLAAVYPSRRELPAKTRAFIDFLVEVTE
ncbi:MAG TPA: LysR substrate-binding domain-containing protein [Woeseiaceae bacterium]|nr:LysR substrate-binding domain-containing protein [Woeseiaceae bacterium]